MKVYHGGTNIIEHPLVNIGRDGLDFGKGFYVTDIRCQAELWAKRLSDRRNEDAILNIYEFDKEKVFTLFRCKKFESYDLNWIDFIVANRKGGELWKKFDLIEGGIADDRVVDTIEGYVAGLISAEKALGKLSGHIPNNQFCITNQMLADEYLHYVESIKL